MSDSSSIQFSEENCPIRVKKPSQMRTKRQYIEKLGKVILKITDDTKALEKIMQSSLKKVQDEYDTLMESKLMETLDLEIDEIERKYTESLQDIWTINM